MMHAATITSKRQLTIPSNLFKQLGWKKGEKVMLSEDQGKIVITKALNLVNQLAGSVSIPKRFQGLTIEEIIEKAKKEQINIS